MALSHSFPVKILSVHSLLWEAVVIISRMGCFLVQPRLDLVMAEEVFDHIVAGAHIGSKLELLEVDQALCLDELQVLGSVQVLLVLSLCEVKFVVKVMMREYNN